MQLTSWCCCAEFLRETADWLGARKATRAARGVDKDP